jgi:hypothetical protein
MAGALRRARSGVDGGEHPSRARPSAEQQRLTIVSGGRDQSSSSDGGGLRVSITGRTGTEVLELRAAIDPARTDNRSPIQGRRAPRYPCLH